MRRKPLRHQQRGAAVFLVVLVVTLLSAMGVFAARASIVSESMAGYDRLEQQTHYVMESGMLITTAEIARSPGAYLAQSMTRSSTDTCYSAPGLAQQYACAKFNFAQLSSAMSAAQTAGGLPQANAMDVPGSSAIGADPNTVTPGSLGPYALSPRFYVEMTDIGPVGRPPAGSSAGAPGDIFGYLQITLSGWGQVSPLTAGMAGGTCGAAEQGAGAITAREAGEARVLIGPLPKHLAILAQKKVVAMPLRKSRLVRALPLAASILVAGRANAQLDVNPPLPNVLLLVDNSGSMEYMAAADPTTGLTRLPTCNPGVPTSTNEQNRWATLLNVLTGTVQNFSCFPEPRSSSDFTTEFGLGGATPYDGNYYVPFNRVLSGSCTLGPDHTTWPPAGANGVYQFPANVVRGHNYNSYATACSGFSQTTDGLLDAFRDRARFGLMTFDTLTDAGTGLSAGSADYTTGPAGLWSYFPSWQTSSAAASTGRPEGCVVNQPIEVGARNAAAPPWEGRMIPFGDYAASQATVQAQNDRIQNALLMLRPYGATPTAGMMADAQYFFLSDPSPDPLDPTNTSKEFGPKDDPYIAGGCRKSYIIILTDGQPNLDLRPGCANNPPAPNGTCPYLTPEDTAYALAHPADPSKAILTFVVGFAVSTVGAGGPAPVNCSSLTPAGSATFDPTNQCASPTTDALKACCQLGRIAFSGGTGNPHFADNADMLRKAINDILSQVAGGSTSRTTPVFASSSSLVASSASLTTNAPGVGYNFFSSFFVSTGALWQGVLERQRFTCVHDPSSPTATAQLQSVDATKGDSFSSNVNSNDAGHPRQLFTYIPTPAAGSTLDATQTVRSTASPPPDGLGALSGASASGQVSSFISAVSPAAMAVQTAASSTCSSTSEPNVTPTQCRDRILGWELGIPQTLPSGVTYSRAGNVFGSIYHSTPTVVSPPSEFLRDESYLAFQTAQKTRPLMLYTATTDGQLHGFQVAPASSSDPLKVDALQNNELWSYFPPAMLPRLRSLYPGVQQALLDGPPIVRDVVLERKSTDAQGSPNAALWTTQLVAGFGSAVPGYYGLDVTNPALAAGGPLFRWQITNDSAGTPLFGGGGTPTIASLYFVPPGQSDAREVAVAILPGGAGADTGATCARASAAFPGVDSNWPPRSSVRCYGATDPSRSITIVRLDTGEVIRTFRTTTTGLAPQLASRTTIAPLDSPITGIVATYPGGTGVLSNRAYVGDRDGTLWRIDLRATDPAQWTVSMFFDMYSGYLPTDGQPTSTAPVLSVDALGNVVVIASTGDQQQFASTVGLRNMVWSLTEHQTISLPGPAALRSQANWHLGRGETMASLPGGVSTDWSNGDRVTGPMSIFNGVVYFSDFRPAASGALSCASGQSALWGVDYLATQSPNARGDVGPAGRLALGAANDLTSTPTAAQQQNAPPAIAESNDIIFGVGLTRTPTCYDTQTFTDPYLGFGSASSIVNMGVGSFQLVVQTGNVGTNVAGGQTKSVAFNLPTPPPTVRVSSWAAVIE